MTLENVIRVFRWKKENQLVYLTPASSDVDGVSLNLWNMMAVKWALISVKLEMSWGIWPVLFYS